MFYVTLYAVCRVSFVVASCKAQRRTGVQRTSVVTSLRTVATVASFVGYRSVTLLVCHAKVRRHLSLITISVVQQNRILHRSLRIIADIPLACLMENRSKACFDNGINNMNSYTQEKVDVIIFTMSMVIDYDPKLWV